MARFLFSQSVFQHVNTALDASDEGDTSPATELGIAEVTESNKQSSESHLGVSEADQQETERGFTQQMSLERDETEAQMSEGIEMTKVKVRTRHNISCSRRHYNWSSMVSWTFLLDWLHPFAFF